jgi:hypothetical protein
MWPALYGIADRTTKKAPTEDQEAPEAQSLNPKSEIKVVKEKINFISIISLALMIGEGRWK